MSQNQAHSFSLEGQLGLITGGGTGLGLGIAHAFVAQGARVVLTGRREEVLRQATADLGAAASYRVHDITEHAAAAALIAAIEQEHGALTALVNNAGHQIHSPAEDFSEEDLQQILDVHVVGAFSLRRHAARRRKNRAPRCTPRLALLGEARSGRLAREPRAHIRARTTHIRGLQKPVSVSARK